MPSDPVLSIQPCVNQILTNLALSCHAAQVGGHHGIWDESTSPKSHRLGHASGGILGGARQRCLPGGATCRRGGK